MSPELGESASDQQNKLSEEEDKEYKVKYRDLKRTLKNVVSKNEYLKSELRHSQKKLQVTKDLKQKLLNFLKSSNRISFFVATMPIFIQPNAQDRSISALKQSHNRSFSSP